MQGLLKLFCKLEIRHIWYDDGFCSTTNSSSALSLLLTLPTGPSIKSHECKLFRVFAVLLPDLKSDTISCHRFSSSNKSSGFRAESKKRRFALNISIAGFAVVQFAQLIKRIVKILGKVKSRFCRPAFKYIPLTRNDRLMLVTCGYIRDPLGMETSGKTPS